MLAKFILILLSTAYLGALSVQPNIEYQSVKNSLKQIHAVQNSHEIIVISFQDDAKSKIEPQPEGIVSWQISKGVQIPECNCLTQYVNLSLDHIQDHIWQLRNHLNIPPPVV